MDPTPQHAPPAKLEKRPESRGVQKSQRVIASPAQVRGRPCGAELGLPADAESVAEEHESPQCEGWRGKNIVKVEKKRNYLIQC